MMVRAAALTLSLIGLSAALAFSETQAANREQPVLVELFTSQGCSDCPPADAILSDLARRADVVALSFPITYWDMLGWTDTLASISNTDRQKAYAQGMNRPATYTPQIIVSGIDDVVGNKRERVFNAIARHVTYNGQVDPVSLSLDYSNAELTIRVTGIAPEGVSEDHPADIWVMRVLSHAEVAIEGGENQDRKLVYTNVVRDIVNVGAWNGGERSIALPVSLTEGDHDGIAVVVQRAGQGPVLATRLVRPGVSASH